LTFGPRLNYHLTRLRYQLLTFFADKLTLLRIGENVDSLPEILEMFRERPNGDKPSPRVF